MCDVYIMDAVGYDFPSSIDTYWSNMHESTVDLQPATLKKLSNIPISSSSLPCPCSLIKVLLHTMYTQVYIKFCYLLEYYSS